MLTGMVFIVQDCAFRWGLVGWGKAMQEGWQRSQPPAAGGTCGAAAFGRARANAPRARARARVAPRWRRRRRPRPRPQSWAPLGGDGAPAAKIFWCTLPSVVVYRPDKAVRWRSRRRLRRGRDDPLAGSSIIIIMQDLLVTFFFSFLSGAVSLSSSRATLWYRETSMGPAIDIDTRTINVSGN